MNAAMGPADLDRFVALDQAGRSLLRKAAENMGLSARAVHRLLKVARTAADLDGCETVAPRHLAEAVSLRSLDWDLDLESMKRADRPRRFWPAVAQSRKKSHPSKPRKKTDKELSHDIFITF